ncbi:hypothetical protein ABW19_dt0205100 [Dactylella cylindrospora]|nr:hypothetical protein ABW19_dt0205100 [Dactylella cylindrospora]
MGGGYGWVECSICDEELDSEGRCGNRFCCNGGVGDAWAFYPLGQDRIQEEPETQNPGGQPNAEDQPSGPAIGKEEYYQWPTLYGLRRYPYLENILKESVGVEPLVKILTAPVGKESVWSGGDAITEQGAVLDLLKASSDNMDKEKHHLDFVAQASDQVVRALGYYRSITPQFFDVPYSIVQTDGGIMYFSIQFFGKYSPGKMPSEARRSRKSPTYSFGISPELIPGSWHISRIGFFVKPLSKGVFYGLILLDPQDIGLAQAIKTLMLGNEHSIPLQKWPHMLGAISSIFYAVNHTWGLFLRDADTHLRDLTNEVLEENIVREQLPKLTRDLHELLKLFSEAKRRIRALKDLSISLKSHPFLSENGLWGMDRALQKTRDQIAENYTKMEELVEDTKILVSLIFNIAHLDHADAAIKESQAANSFALNIQRITAVTFIYLPITLAATVFGMNIQQITGDEAQYNIWVFLGLGTVLLICTLLVLLSWLLRKKIVGLPAKIQQQLQHTYSDAPASNEDVLKG